jgi:hypothetical protein
MLPVKTDGLIVYATVGAQPLPHEAGFGIADRPVAVVDVGTRQPVLQLAVLSRGKGGSADNGISCPVVAGRLSGLQALSRRGGLAGGEIRHGRREVLLAGGEIRLAVWQWAAGECRGDIAGVLGDEALQSDLVTARLALAGAAVSADDHLPTNFASHLVKSGAPPPFTAVASALSRQTPYFPATLSFAA